MSVEILLNFLVWACCPPRPKVIGKSRSLVALVYWELRKELGQDHRCGF